MTRCKLLLLLITFIASTCSLHAQQADDSLYARLDEYLNAADSAYKFNGTALIAQHGRIVLQKGYGYKDVDTKTLNDTSGIFKIGSITKQFTATVILKLQEEGKLSVKDRLDKYFPQFIYGNDITIEHLLTHTSGIYNYTDDIDDNDSALVSNPVSKYVVLDIVFNKPLAFPPGTQFRYCNSGYYLLGLIVEKVTGQPYETVVRKLLFDPLQMQHSGFDFRHLADTNKTTGYQTLNANERIIAQRWDSTVTYSAGAIYSTCSDLYKWTKAIAQRQILSSTSWEQAFTPHLQHYGYGFFIDTLFGRQCIRHSGGLPGFVSYLSYYPAEDITIILLNNKGYYGEGLTSISTGLAAIMLHQPYQLLTAHKEVILPADSLKKYTGIYAFDKKHKAFITLEDNRLHMAAPSGGLPKSPLYAESDTLFYLKVVDGIIEFVKDNHGNITQLISHVNGHDEVCRKVK